MFTLEESKLLIRLIRYAKWLIITLMLAGTAVYLWKHFG